MVEVELGKADIKHLYCQMLGFLKKWTTHIYKYLCSDKMQYRIVGARCNQGRQLFKTELHSVSFLTCGWRVTCREGITNEAWVAPADWAVPGHRALGVHPADPRTGVHAFISHTCLVSWAIWIDGAFRLAFNVRVALQARQTGAGGSALPVAAHGVDAAWRRSAWVNGAWCGSYKKGAS